MKQARFSEVLHRYPWQSGQRRQIREVADAGEAEHGDFHFCGALAGASGWQAQGIFFVELHVGIKRQDAKHRAAGALLEVFKTALQKARITPELVDHKADNPLAFLRSKQLAGADELREHAAALNVGD